MKCLNEQKIYDKIYQILENAVNYSCEFKDHYVIVRFGTWINAKNAKPITIKKFNEIAEEFKDPNIEFLSGSYEIMLTIQINNDVYFKQ